MEKYLLERLAVWRQIKSPVGLTVTVELEIALARLQKAVAG